MTKAFKTYEEWAKGQDFSVERELCIKDTVVEGPVLDVADKLRDIADQHPDKTIYISIVTDGYDCAYETFYYNEEMTEEEKSSKYTYEKDKFELEQKALEKERIRKEKMKQFNNLKRELGIR